MYANLFESQLERLARTLTEQFGVKVVCQGDNAWTDGRRIILPSLLEPMDEALERMMVGYLDHGTAHAAFSDFGVAEQFARNYPRPSFPSFPPWLRLKAGLGHFDDLPVVGQGHARGEFLVGGLVRQLVGDVGEVGLSGADAAGGLDGLLQVEVRGVRTATPFAYKGRPSFLISDTSGGKLNCSEPTRT